MVSDPIRATAAAIFFILRAVNIPERLTVARADALAQFKKERFSAVPILRTEHVQVMIVAFEPGQEIPLHAPQVNLVVTVASGSGELYADGRVQALHEGDVALVPAGETRGIRARAERLVLVNTVTPLPGADDHGPVAASWPEPDDAA